MGLSREVFGPALRSAMPSSDLGWSFSTVLPGIGPQQTTAQRPGRSLRHVYALGHAVPPCQQQGTASSAAEHSPATYIGTVIRQTFPHKGTNTEMRRLCIACKLSWWPVQTCDASLLPTWWSTPLRVSLADRASRNTTFRDEVGLCLATDKGARAYYLPYSPLRSTMYGISPKRTAAWSLSAGVN
jgi:hypothetical protein